MKYEVLYSVKSLKTLEKMDKPTAAIIYGWIEKNLVGCENPRRYGSVLTGSKKGFWRYRVGSYRLLAEILDNNLHIEIINIGHRSDIYR
jgi:mRNA interferase RelE/StbE